MVSTWLLSAKTIASESMNPEHLVDLLRCEMVGRTGETMLLILEGGGKGGGRREGKRHTGGRREGERHWREEGSALQECTLVLQEGEGPEGSRGARLVWVDKERIVVSGFNKLSEQCRSPCACPPVLLTIEGLETCNMHTQLSMHTHTHTILHLHVHNTHANTYTTLMHTHTHTPPRPHPFPHLTNSLPHQTGAVCAHSVCITHKT